MARASKLSEKQWAEIEQRLLNGESGCSLAKEFGISYNAIKKRLGSQVNQTKAVANQIIEAENALKALPVGSQINVVNLASKLRSVSEHLAGAAEKGAMTAHRLAEIANTEAMKVDDVNPMESVEQLRNVGALTDMANKASTIGLNLLAANKEMVKAGMMEEPVQPVKIVVQVEDARLP